jgi:hypothetical protein
MQIILISPSWAPAPAAVISALSSSNVAYTTVPTYPGVSTIPCVIAVDSLGAVRFEWRNCQGLTAAALQAEAAVAPTPLPGPALPPVALSPLQFIVYLQSQGITNAQISTLKASTDPNISAFMFMLQLAGREIVPNGQLVTQGLALLVSESVITTAEQAAIVANWPTSPLPV